MSTRQTQKSLGSNSCLPLSFSPGCHGELCRHDNRRRHGREDRSAADVGEGFSLYFADLQGVTDVGRRVEARSRWMPSEDADHLRTLRKPDKSSASSEEAG